MGSCGRVVGILKGHPVEVDEDQGADRQDRPTAGRGRARARVATAVAVEGGVGHPVRRLDGERRRCRGPACAHHPVADVVRLARRCRPGWQGRQRRRQPPPTVFRPGCTDPRWLLSAAGGRRPGGTAAGVGVPRGATRRSRGGDDRAERHHRQEYKSRAGGGHLREALGEPGRNKASAVPRVGPPVACRHDMTVTLRNRSFHGLPFLASFPGCMGHSVGDGPARTPRRPYPCRLLPPRLRVGPAPMTDSYLEAPSRHRARPPRSRRPDRRDRAGSRRWS